MPKRENQERLAEEIVADIKNGKVNAITVEKFAKLMKPEKLKENKTGPHFGNAPLPDDDWQKRTIH